MACCAINCLVSSVKLVTSSARKYVCFVTTSGGSLNPISLDGSVALSVCLHDNQVPEIGAHERVGTLIVASRAVLGTSTGGITLVTLVLRRRALQLAAS